MGKISKEEQNEMVKQLKTKYNCEDAYYLGYQRYVIINSRRIQLERGNNTIFPRIRSYRLTDEIGNLINLTNEYNFIAIYVKGVAEVWNQIDYQIKEGDSGLVAVDIRKFGLIDVNGKELLPVIYDNVGAHADGFVEITKDGIKKMTTITILERGDYSWDDPNGIKKLIERMKKKRLD